MYFRKADQVAESNMRLVYRIQLNRDFPLDEAEKVLPYLRSLGVSHVYLSPIMRAVSGSNHCYDVTDFGQVNPELGGENAFRNFSATCSSLGLGILLDTVPNHMAYSPENPYVEAAFIDGTRKFRWLFDTFRNPFSPHDSIVFPFLPQSLISLVNQHRVSITPGSIPVLHVGSLDIPLRKMPEINGNTNQNNGMESRAEETTDSLPDIEISNIQTLEEIIRDLPLRPVFWQYASKRINYRRFFSVNGLIAIRSQDMNVIRFTHRKIIELSRSSCVTGIRVDHLDGLYDPSGYVRYLRNALPDKIILAEKVLIPGERLPESMEIHGTTGYDFLGMINALYADAEGYYKLQDRFHSSLPEYGKIPEVLLNYKRDFIMQEFSGDVDNLSWPVYNALVLEHGYEYSYSEIREAVINILTSFEKYRTYSTAHDTTEIAEHLLNSEVGSDNSIARVLSDHVSHKCNQCIHSVLRIQQFSGALMAKNLEDRLFFSYNPLIFMNEVGWTPESDIPDWEGFMEFIRKRENLPFSLNEGSTHDTKFGEDLRNSGLVISEYPDVFFRILEDLRSREDTRSRISNMAEEHLYYILQLVLASYGSADYYTDYRKQLDAQIIKAMRESMLSTSWKNPDLEYENNAMEFARIIVGLLESGNWEMGTRMAEKCRDLGRYNSISMLVLRFMLPGVPALFQGTESINVHFTDPDNREMVNFNRLVEKFEKTSSMPLKSLDECDFSCLKSRMVAVLSTIRRELAHVIDSGKLEALQVSGDHSESILSYYMVSGNELIIVVSLRLFSKITSETNALDPDRLEDTSIVLPSGFQGKYIDLLSGRTVVISGYLKIRHLVDNIPAVILRRVGGLE